MTPANRTRNAWRDCARILRARRRFAQELRRETLRPELLGLTGELAKPPPAKRVYFRTQSPDLPYMAAAIAGSCVATVSRRSLGKAFTAARFVEPESTKDERIGSEKAQPKPGRAPPYGLSPRRRGPEPSAKPARPAARRLRRGDRGRVHQDREGRGGSCPRRSRNPRRAPPPAPAHRCRGLEGLLLSFGENQHEHG
jgi:hypothetical protein